MTAYPTLNFKTVLFALATISFCSADVSSSAARGTGWSPVVIATGEYRQQIKSLPIEQRPNRPLHFYGNAVRRSYYQGGAFPTGTMSVGQYPTQSLPYSVSRPPMSLNGPATSIIRPLIATPQRSR